MTTFTTDHAGSGEIPPRFEQRTYNLAANRLRQHEELRSTIYGPSPAAETMILDNTGVPYRYKVPTFTALSHGPDAWIGEMLQEPPTGPIPPLPPTPPQPTKLYTEGVERCGCCGHERKPFLRHGKRRRQPLLAWMSVACGLGVILGAGALGGILAVVR